MLDEEERYNYDDNLGEVELSVQWYHDPKAAELAKKQRNIFDNIRRTIGKMKSTVVCYTQRAVRSVGSLISTLFAFALSNALLATQFTH